MPAPKNTPWKSESFARRYRGIDIYVDKMYIGRTPWAWVVTYADIEGRSRNRLQAQRAAEKAVDKMLDSEI